jgi:hypothetical protein
MSDKLKPMFLVKPKSVSRRDINRAEKQCGVCIIECSDPESSRYSEAPMGADLDAQAQAALSLMRTIVSANQTDFKKSELTKWFVDQILTWNRPAHIQRTTPVKNG